MKKIICILGILFSTHTFSQQTWNLSKEQLMGQECSQNRYSLFLLVLC
jgi:hypothetical protein